MNFNQWGKVVFVSRVSKIQSVLCPSLLPLEVFPGIPPSDVALLDQSDVVRCLDWPDTNYQTEGLVRVRSSPIQPSRQLRKHE